MSCYTRFPSQPQLYYSYDNNHSGTNPVQPQAQHLQEQAYRGGVNFNSRDTSVQAPQADNWQQRYDQQSQNVNQNVSAHSPASTLAHALDDLHVSYEQQDDPSDPNTFYEYGQVLRHRRPGYDGAGASTTFPMVDQVECMETAQVSCAEYGESYCSDDDSPYGALASPLSPYDAASPFAEVVDSPTDLVDGPFAVDTIHSPIHYNAQTFDHPIVPTRSYTLEQAVILPLPSERSSSLADTKRSASASTAQSDTASSGSIISRYKSSTPSSVTTVSTAASSNGSGKSRGRPRKRQPTANSSDSMSPPPVVDYPFPKFDSPPAQKIPTPPIDTKRIAPRPEERVHTPTVLSMDEIPMPDAESKPGQAIFKLNTPPEAKEKPKKKPILACLFCRERKIACGQPLPGSTKCNQCARRGLDCEFPKESRRGQHKRGPRAARVAALTEAAMSAKRPIEPAPFPTSSVDGSEDVRITGPSSNGNKRVKIENTDDGKLSGRG